MKKIFLILTILLLSMVAVSANVLPTNVNQKSSDTFGVYQARDNITVYKKPDEHSKIIYNIHWDRMNIYPNSLTFSDVFFVFMPSKSLGLMYVTDETEDWVEVIYNIPKNARGWVKKDDPYRFATWVNFYNMYGRKYGLIVLKNAPEDIKKLKSADSSDSKTVAEIKFPAKIHLNVIKGNWALVSVFDADRTSKTGYIRWRDDNGIKYLFPDIK